MTFTRERFNDPFRFSGASASKSAEQTGMSGSQLITFDGTHWDTDSYFDNANDQFVIPTGLDGYFRITVVVATLNSGGNAWVDILTTTSESNPSAVRIDRETSTSPQSHAGSTVFKLAAGDTVSVRTQGDASYSVRESANGTVFQIERLGN